MGPLHCGEEVYSVPLWGPGWRDHPGEQKKGGLPLFLHAIPSVFLSDSLLPPLFLFWLTVHLQINSGSCRGELWLAPPKWHKQSFFFFFSYFFHRREQKSNEASLWWMPLWGCFSTFPLPLSLFIQSYISTSGVGRVAHSLVPVGIDGAASLSRSPLCAVLRESSSR